MGEGPSPPIFLLHGLREVCHSGVVWFWSRNPDLRCFGSRLPMPLPILARVSQHIPASYSPVHCHFRAGMAVNGKQ